MTIRLGVMLVEQDVAIGGSLLWEDQAINGQPARDWVRARSIDLAAMPNVKLLTRTSLSGFYDHGLLTALETTGDHAVRQRLWHIRATRVILATGALERPMVFPGNDRPGIMLGSAVRQYLRRHRVSPGSAVVITTNNDHGYSTAQALVAEGIHVAAIVDSRPGLVRAIGDIPVHPGSVIAGTAGRARVRSVLIRSLDGARSTRVACDLVAMSGGWNPAVQLHCQAGGTLRFNEAISAFVPDRPPPSSQCVGAAAGLLRLEDCLRSGWAAGNATGQASPWRVDNQESDEISPIWQVPVSIAHGGRGRSGLPPPADL